MIYRETFYNYVRRNPFPGRLTQKQVIGMGAILNEWDERGHADFRWLAYMFATAYHETAYKMLPIKEYGGYKYFMRMYDKSGSRPHVARALGNTHHGDGAKYCGRGYVQLTGRRNYTLMSEVTGVDLVNDPDRAMDPDVAAEIMFHGMIHGTFTGRRLPQYFNRETTSWYGARRIINGTDRAATIGRYGRAFHYALNKADVIDDIPLPPVEVEEPEEKVENPITVALKRGSKHFDEVRRLQERLEITVDGDFGPKTERAVKHFQENNGLLVDGIAGPNTLKALSLA